MDDISNGAVEDNSLSYPIDETTLTDNTEGVIAEKPEQAADTSDTSEPSESPAKTNEEVSEKRTRFQKRIDKKNAELAELRGKMQLNPALFLPQSDIPEFEDPDFDRAVTQKADAIAKANMSQFAASLQAQNTVNTYITNSIEDTAYLRGKHSILNPDSPEYDPEVEEAISEVYEMSNPIEKNGQFNSEVNVDLRLKDIAEKYLRTIGRYQQKGQTQASRDLAEAADNAILQPTSNVRPKKQETLDQMRERLGNIKF